EEVHVGAVLPEHLEPFIGATRLRALEQVAQRAGIALEGRQVLNVNSTAAGGGVAELLQTLLAYTRGVGIDARWVVIAGDPDFFAITKRLHDGLYGSSGDGGPLGNAERRHYESVLRHNAAELLALVRPGDVVLLHDPQTAGLARELTAVGARVAWRCHVGRDEPNELTRRAWEFLRPYVDDVAAFVFSKAEFAPPWVTPDRLTVIPPSIDPFSPKNELIEPAEVVAILQYVGLLDGERRPRTAFTRRDGSPGRVDRHADILQTGPPPPPDAPLVLQASRWDVWKDMRGVMTGFADHLEDLTDTHLVLAGPSVHSVADDPAAARVLDDCIAAWRALPHAIRARTHLACVPMADADEAAVIVNALQRHATVVVQKSLAEGFGLTVAEAMWKHRPVIASAVGGITDQIVDGETGCLLRDPGDLDAFAVAVRRLLADPAEQERIGRRAHTRVLEKFLPDRHLAQWTEVIGMLLAAPD
ncbi:MAG: glycosyltransferase, partial [Acidimicrobiia bacterium]